MDIRRNPFPSSFMTAPGGLEYLKMPMGLVQVSRVLTALGFLWFMVLDTIQDSALIALT